MEQLQFYPVGYFDVVHAGIQVPTMIGISVIPENDLARLVYARTIPERAHLTLTTLHKIIVTRVRDESRADLIRKTFMKSGYERVGMLFLPPMNSDINTATVKFNFMRDINVPFYRTK